MRRNAFGEAYCSTADEVAEEMERVGQSARRVYCPMIEAPSDGDSEWVADVAQNQSGDTVLRVVGPTREAVAEILSVAGIEVQS